MTVEFTAANPTPTRRSRRRWAWLAAIPAVPLGVAGAGMWYFTAPLEDIPGPVATPPPAAAPAPVAAATVAEAEPAWPEGTLDGEPAKELLLRILRRTGDRLARHEGYSATFRKQERINGALGAEQTLSMKVRNQPFAVYLKFLAPKAGKEVVYAEGHHGNKLIAHNGDWTRKLVPRLALDPDSSLALADNRHPITEAGLVNLVRKLVRFRELDMADAAAVTILDRTEDGKLLRSVHTHPIQNPDRPFARVEVLYDPATLRPVQMSGYDWPRPGQVGELELAERYRYEDVRFDPIPTAIDFDPANPAYEFTRF